MRNIFALSFAMLLVTACTEAPPPVSSEGSPLYADMHYYPTLIGTSWDYRIDTTGSAGMVKGVGQIHSSITGTFDTDSLLYAVQVNQVVINGTTEYDSLYIRKALDGVRFSSPGLQQVGGLGGLLDLAEGELPTEFLIVPDAAGFQATWQIITIEFNEIPFLPIFYRVEGSFRGIEDVVTDQRTYRDCAHIVISIEAQLPNLEDPTDIFNPMRMNEHADFWFTRPHGLVVADGSNAIFELLRGGMPLSDSFSRMRQEVINMDIVQPEPFCLDR